MCRKPIQCAFFLALWITAFDFTSAQQVTVSTPVVGVHDSFYENFNIGWGFRWRSPRGSMFFNFPMSATPPFGGYNPNADARFGVARQWGNGEFGFVISASQGNQRSLTMDSSTITMMNGVPGSIRSTALRPFVVGLIPVVGDFPVIYYPELPFGPAPPPVLVSPLAERLERLNYAKQHPEDSPDALVLTGDGEDSPPASGAAPSSRTSSAQRGDVSVADIRRQQADEDAELQREIARLIDEARAAEQGGMTSVARLRYKQAAAKAKGDQRRELLKMAARLDPKN